MKYENPKVIPITGIFGQHIGEDGESCFVPIGLDKDKRLLVRIPVYRNTLKMSITLDLTDSRQNQLIAEDIDGFTVFSVSGGLTLSLDEPVKEKEIFIDKCFSYAISAKKIFISNESQPGGSVVLLFESLEEVV